MSDEAVRARIREDLDTTMLVEAAAGTGKTTALVNRMVAALAAGRTRLDTVVAVTFTEAAAGELKLRLRTAIEQAAQEPGRSAATREALGTALRQLEAARIATIHAFCAELLRERPVEACVDPRFTVAAEDTARALFDRAFDRWFEAQLACPGPGMRRMLRRRAGRDDVGVRDRVRSAAWLLAEWRDFPAPWRREPFDRAAAIAAILDRLRALVTSPDDGPADDWFARSIAAIARVVREIERRQRADEADLDGVEAELVALARARCWNWRGRTPRASEPARAARRAAREETRAALDAFVRAAGADLAPQLRDDLLPVLGAYERLKRRAGVLDFLDLLLHARDLVRDQPAVRAALQARFTHIFVDELQDTDPLQMELLLLLAADDPAEGDWRRVRPVPGKLFLVGDPKQSIYRFRRADLGLYDPVKRRIASSGGAVLRLATSFRAVPALQAAVNLAFAEAMRGEHQAPYVALAPHRADHPDQPAVVALPVPQPFGERGEVTAAAIEASLPGAVAAFVEWLVRESGWTVTERERPGTRFPLVPRHVCLLFRRMRSHDADVTRPYIRALEARGLRHVLVGGSAFHRREEIGALRAALRAIEWPTDELALFATLRGPFFALDDGALLAWRARFGSLHPFRDVPAGLPPALADVAEALAVLRELHRHRNRRPVAETLVRLLAAVRAPAALAVWPAGEQALANVGRLLDIARRAERRGLTSFRAFVESLEHEAETGETGEAALVEEGTEGVRLMTVHRAKGLEFPVVILVDPTARATRLQPTRYLDPDRRLCALALAGLAPADLLEHAETEQQREEEEAVRVLYVAATRARDLLVVPVVGEGPCAGWLAPLAPAIRPGRPALAWWPVDRLRLDAEEQAGIVQQQLLAADEERVRADAGIAAHAAWKAARARSRAAAAVPSLRVRTVTELAVPESVDEPGAEPPAVCELTTVRIETDPHRPQGVRFGTLVHAVLAAVDPKAGPAEVRAAAVLEGRVLGAPSDEVEAAVVAVTRALAHPVLREAAAAGDYRRECPVLLRLDDGTLAEGVLDAAFLIAGRWTIVDFKTDLSVDGREGQYRCQLALYCLAVARATGRPVRGVLMAV